MQRLAILLLCASLLFNVGCAGFAQYREEQNARRELDSRTSWVDNNWKAGYGFNNPNADRIRQGLEPVNFSGNLDSEEDHGFFETLVGDFLGYGIKSAFKTSFNALTNLTR